MNPFFHRVADAIRGVRSDWLVFAEVSRSALSPAKVLRPARRSEP